MHLKATALFAALFLPPARLRTPNSFLKKRRSICTRKPGDQEVVANFKYENKGKTVVNIKNVNSSCGCTVATLKKNDVQPGEKGEVTATFKIGGRTGVQSKTVSVQTDDPNQPMVNLVLQATIAQAVEVQPSFVFWEQGEAPKPKKITVKAGKNVKINKIDVTTSTPDFTATVDKGSSAGRVHDQRRAEEHRCDDRCRRLRSKPDSGEVF